MESKQNQTVQCWGSTPDLLDSSRGWGRSSRSVFFSTHDCVPGSGWLHCTAVAVLGGRPMALANRGGPLGCAFPIGSLSGAKPQNLCMAPLVLGLQLPLRRHLHQWPIQASHSAKPQLLSLTPSGLKSQYHLCDSYTSPTCTTMTPSRTQLPRVLRKHFRGGFTSMMLVFSLNSQLLLTSIEYPSKAEIFL